MHGGKVELTAHKTTLFTISLPLDGENAIPMSLLMKKGILIRINIPSSLWMIIERLCLF